MPWTTWSYTVPSRFENKLRFGNDFTYIDYSTEGIEVDHPGFLYAYYELTSLGCDEHFVTDVLKFCIVHAGNERLGDFLSRPEIIQSVETALAIGLSGNELVALLTNGEAVTLTAVLPDDMSLDTSS